MNESLVALIIEAVSISETSVNVYHITRHNITEDSHLLCYYCLSLIDMFCNF